MVLVFACCGAECEESSQSATLKRCSACTAAYYCTSDCQRGDWRRHKPVCVPIKHWLRFNGDKLNNDSNNSEDDTNNNDIHEDDEEHKHASQQQRKSKSNWLARMPAELVNHVYSFLTAAELGAVSRLSPVLRPADSLWRDVFWHRWPLFFADICATMLRQHNDDTQQRDVTAMARLTADDMEGVMKVAASSARGFPLCATRRAFFEAVRDAISHHTTSKRKQEVWRRLHEAVFNGTFSCRAQVYNKEIGVHKEFAVSAYDADVSHMPEQSGRFVARYLPDGRQPVREMVTRHRMRTLVESADSPFALANNVDLAQLRVGSFVEIQWRRSPFHPFGWWFGEVASIDAAHSRVTVIFRQYFEQSPWYAVEMTVSPTKSRAEMIPGGQVGGIRLVRSETQVVRWKSFMPAMKIL
eukprot:TRINITY_DN65873_c5_g5_i1.p1 TRINITY_DN65873_c5_g5~~TRINITY_DN65873_c5_g5_i1.p1  ORF type:complete len:412 (-),score=174.37 TRINITY_DN65873_c5_g5_i1:788-2023(-)